MSHSFPTRRSSDLRVDFGIVADKKALPHASDFAKAIEAAFAEAAELMKQQLPLAKLAVAKATDGKKLEAALSEKASPRRDTLIKSKLQATPNAPSHGKPVVKKIAKRQASKQAA